MYNKSNNEHYDIDKTRLYFVRIEAQAQAITLRKMVCRILVQVLVELIGLSVVFINCIVKEWNSLPNPIREDNNYL